MKIEERNSLTAKLSEAMVAVAQDNLEALDVALAAIIREKPTKNYLFETWHTDDVIGQVNRLTQEQAQEVLQYTQAHIDGGVTLDTFDAVASQLFPEPNLTDFKLTLDNEYELLISVPEGLHPTDTANFYGHITGSDYMGPSNGAATYHLPEDQAKLQAVLDERYGK